MCLIIDKPENVVLPTTHIYHAYHHNNDGFGIMWADRGSVHHVKGLFGINEISELFSEHQSKSFVAHFRFATVGSVSKENSHPFQILEKKKNGVDLWMMHNGTLSMLDNIPGNYSDTGWFVESYLKPLLSHNSSLIYDNGFQKILSSAIGRSKLVFLDSNGGVVRINSELGHQQNGIWYSNQYSIAAPKEKKKGKSNRSDKNYTPIKSAKESATVFEQLFTLE